MYEQYEKDGVDWWEKMKIALWADFEVIYKDMSQDCNITNDITLFLYRIQWMFF